jgi:hypothetical protein
MCFKGILVVALVVAGGTHFKPFVLSIRVCPISFHQYSLASSFFCSISRSFVSEALGRCIRHINDYGVIVLLDSRYSHNIAQLSHWLQASVQVNKTVADAVQTLRSFFASINENIAQKP